MPKLFKKGSTSTGVILYQLSRCRTATAWAQGFAWFVGFRSSIRLAVCSVLLIWFGLDSAIFSLNLITRDLPVFADDGLGWFAEFSS